MDKYKYKDFEITTCLSYYGDTVVKNLNILETEEKKTDIEKINKIEKELNKVIPDKYKEFLLLTNGAVMDNFVLYGLERLAETDKLYDIDGKYISIGNDNGDYEIIMEACKDSVLCSFMEAGSVDIPESDDWFEFEDWINKGCPLLDESEYNVDLLSDLLYEESTDKLIDFIRQTKDSMVLHTIAFNYNWDDGFDVPRSIVENEFCDLGTALMIFSDADGYSFLIEGNNSLFSDEQLKFISDLKLKIEKRDFQNSSFLYVPELSRIMLFKIKKNCPDLDTIFINGTEGTRPDVPVL